MMRYHFDDVREREEPVAVLRASERLIYGRYGYGVATKDTKWQIGKRDAAFAVDASGAGKVSMVAADDARKLLPEIYAGAAPETPGFLSRRTEVWDHYFEDMESWRGGFTSNRYAIYREGGEPLGYLRYRVKDTWEDAIPKNELLAAELIALAPAAEIELWRFAFSTDLVDQIRTQNRPEDDLIDFLLADPRRLKRSSMDGLWVRLVDVPAGLAARRYRTEGRLVIEVNDPFLPEQGGRFLLEGGPEGAECRRTSDEPDLIVDPITLGSRYLGAGSFKLSRAVGQISGSDEAIHLADTMFSWDSRPWCPHYF